MIKPIKDEASYNKALARIENLWGCTVGSSEGDQLDTLIT